MTDIAQEPGANQDSTTRAIETTIRLTVVALLAWWCFEITRPFFMPIVWGIVIATSVYPAFIHLATAMGGRLRTAAGVITIVGLSILIVPTMLFAESLVSGGQWLSTGLEAGTLVVPPPPESVAGWPVVGASLHQFWSLASSDFEQAVREVGPRLVSVGAGLLSAVAGAGLGVLQFALSIVIAGVLLAGSDSGHRIAQAVATRFAGERGPALADLAANTVRSVAQGILGVALIQSVLLGIGMLIAGIPHAGLWALLCLMFAVIQLPTLLVMLPIIFWEFSVASTTAAVLFTIWTLLAGASDNVLKPMLLGRGLDLPMIVIFVGAIGGFMTTGFIGLFVGAVILALGYKLFMAWLALETQSEPPLGGERS